VTNLQHELSTAASGIPTAERAVGEILRISDALFPKYVAVTTAILLRGCKTEETVSMDPALTPACRLQIEKLSVQDCSIAESRTGAMVVV
jgi:hypothetical protein